MNARAVQTRHRREKEMRKTTLATRLATLSLLAAAALLGGCSGSTEDVRVTFCKDLATALKPDAKSIEWTGNQNSFKRPEFAITALTFEVVGQDGDRRGGRAACHYAYEALEDTAITLADPLSAYATLPFKMTLDGVALSDAELLRLVNAEQKRRGRQVLETLQRGAQDAAAKVRAGIGQ